MQIKTIADITCVGGVATPISATSIIAKWVQITVVSAAANVRIGDSSVGASRGVPTAGSGFFYFPQDATDLMGRWDLSNIFYFATAGDVLSILYA